MSIHENPLISIIIPNYNYAQYLTEAIDSALNQTYQPIEVIVVDDGSTDDSRKLIQSYHHRIHAIFQANQGPSVARNVGINMARGTYILFLDSDDRLLPDALTHLFDMFTQHPTCGMIFGGAEFIDKTGNNRNFHCYGQRYFSYQDLLIANAILTPEAMVKKEVFDVIGYFDPYFFHCEDYDLWLRISKQFPILHIPIIVAHVRKHGQSLSENTIKHLTQEFEMKQRYDDRSILMRRVLGDICHRLAYEYRMIHKRMLFRHYVWKSITYNPFYAKNYLYLFYSWFMSSKQ